MLMGDCVQNCWNALLQKVCSKKGEKVTTIFTMHMVKSYQGIVCQEAQWFKWFLKIIFVKDKIIKPLQKAIKYQSSKNIHCPYITLHFVQGKYCTEQLAPTDVTKRFFLIFQSKNVCFFFFVMNACFLSKAKLSYVIQKF